MMYNVFEFFVKSCHYIHIFRENQIGSLILPFLSQFHLGIFFVVVN